MRSFLLISAILFACEAQTQTDQRENCLGPFISLANRCYYFSLGVRVNWWLASESCKILEAALAPIYTQEVNDALMMHIENVIQQDTWVGGTDQGDEGQWYWDVDFSPANFTNWAPGEPNNFLREEHCMVIYGKDSKGWHDTSCARTAAFVCQKMPNNCIP